LGYAYLLANEYDLAEQQFKRVLQQVPAFADMSAYLGLIYWQTGRTKMAEAAFDQALQIDGSSRLARQLLAEYDLNLLQTASPGTSTQLLKARGEQALALLNSLHAQMPNDTLIELDLAKFDAVNHNYDSAVTHYQQAIKLSGGQLVHGVNPGVQLIQLYTDQNLDPCGQGLSQVKQTLENTAADPSAWYEAGLTYFMCGQSQAAQAAFQHALQLHPFWPTALYRLGLVYQASGENEQAEALFTQASDLDPLTQWSH
jgi:tetratricopeptide (TPR) repeat protein